MPDAEREDYAARIMELWNALLDLAIEIGAVKTELYASGSLSSASFDVTLARARTDLLESKMREGAFDLALRMMKVRDAFLH